MPDDICPPDISSKWGIYLTCEHSHYTSILYTVFVIRKVVIFAIIVDIYVIIFVIVVFILFHHHRRKQQRQNNNYFFYATI